MVRLPVGHGVLPQHRPDRVRLPGPVDPIRRQLPKPAAGPVEPEPTPGVVTPYPIANIVFTYSSNARSFDGGYNFEPTNTVTVATAPGGAAFTGSQFVLPISNRRQLRIIGSTGSLGFFDTAAVDATNARHYKSVAANKSGVVVAVGGTANSTGLPDVAHARGVDVGTNAAWTHATLATGNSFSSVVVVGDVFYACTPQHLWGSEDGASWSLIGPLPSDPVATSATRFGALGEFNGRLLLSGFPQTGARESLWASDDFGLSWSLLDDANPWQTYQWRSSSETVLFPSAAASRPGLFASTDGESFTKVNLPGNPETARILVSQWTSKNTWSARSTQPYAWVTGDPTGLDGWEAVSLGGTSSSATFHI